MKAEPHPVPHLKLKITVSLVVGSLHEALPGAAFHEYLPRIHLDVGAACPG
jgi:hypothetical protein